MKLEIELTKATQITLTGQPIYADKTPTQFGDGRDGEEQYVATIIPHLLKVGSAIPFTGQHTGREIYGEVVAIEGRTTGKTEVSVDFPAPGFRG
jgi:hypothetical protein